MEQKIDFEINKADYEKIKIEIMMLGAKTKYTPMEFVVILDYVTKEMFQTYGINKIESTDKKEEIKEESVEER